MVTGANEKEGERLYLFSFHLSDVLSEIHIFLTLIIFLMPKIHRGEGEPPIKKLGSLLLSMYNVVLC